MLLCFVFSAGCAQPEPASESAAESIEAAAEEGAVSSAVDSLISDDGERSVAQKLRDASVAAEVLLALVDDRDLRAFNLEPVAVNGQLVLQGEVETIAQRERAESVAADVRGVRDVINRITSTEEPLIAESRDESAMEVSAESQAEEVPSAEAPAAFPEPESEASESEATYHTVENGDNLWDIARAYDVSVEQITRLNGLGSSSIKPGQRLQVK